MMKNSLDNICENIAERINTHPCGVELPREVKIHLNQCRECKFVFEENQRLKRIIKGAVERTPVPEELAIRILERIRNS